MSASLTTLPMIQLQQLFAAIRERGGEARLVGGCVRDILQNKRPKDIDIATTLKPEAILELGHLHSYKCIPTGIEHGTVTVLIGYYQFEVTTLRADVECNGRHARVQYTDNWQEDSNRRDFTFNAIYLDLDGNILDYHNGYEDLKQRVVKFIGDPTQRILEDHLRILRYYRFLSYYGAEQIDGDSMKAVIDQQELIKLISGERIRLELEKISAAKYAVQTIELMSHNGFMPLLELSALRHRIRHFTDAFDVNLGILVHACGLTFEQTKCFLDRLKLSNKVRKSVISLCFAEHKLGSTEFEHKKYLYFYGKGQYLQALQLEAAFTGVQQPALGWHPEALPVHSSDIIALGFSGAEIGKCQRRLENLWVNSNFTLSKQQLLDSIMHKQ